jgi:hypothetical protein
MGWWEDITGQTQAQAAARGQEAATAAAGQANKIATDQAAAAKTAGAGYDAGLAGSLGANAGDYAAKANASAQGQATQQAQAASTQAAQQAARAAKSGGMNAGEAALIGGQQVGNVYQQQLASGMQQGTQLYGQGAQMLGAAGAEQANRQQNAAGTMLSGGGLVSGQAAQQAAQGQANNNQFWGTIANIGGALLSDKRAKRLMRAQFGISKGIEDDIKPTAFEYKDGMGDGGGIQNDGVIAQDVEKSKIGDVVQTGGDGLKRMDPGKTLMAALGLISDLSSRISELEGGK